MSKGAKVERQALTKLIERFEALAKQYPGGTYADTAAVLRKEKAEEAAKIGRKR